MRILLAPFTGLAAETRGEILTASGHSMRLTARRSATIVSRARLLAAVLAVLTPLWSIIDFWTLPPALRLEVTPIRALASVAFAAIVVFLQGAHTLRHAYRAIGLLFAVLSAFYLYCDLYALHQGASVLLGFESGCAYLPLVMLAAFAIFPLTAAECAAIVGPVVVLQLAVSLSAQALDAAMLAAPLAISVLVAGLSSVAAMSQLASTAALVRESLHDPLTGCYARRAGEELLEVLFNWTRRSEAALSLALVVPDAFQAVNERFGYDFGDAALRDITVRLHDGLRTGDLLIRWTGDEYLLVMPLASAEQATAAVQRLLARGLGLRPDGQPITASIGIAEAQRDQASDWWMLVDSAAARMRAARERGGNCTVER